MRAARPSYSPPRAFSWTRRTLPGATGAHLLLTAERANALGLTDSPEAVEVALPA